MKGHLWVSTRLQSSAVVGPYNSLFMDLTITYKYQSPISNDINILCVVYVFILQLWMLV